MRTLVIGDIHGGYKALKQVFEASNLNYEEDRVISLGDIVDGWSESFECVEELLKIKNLISIRGNHDIAFYNFLKTGQHEFNWGHGSKETLKSYCNNLDKQVNFKMSGLSTDLEIEHIPIEHINFFKNQVNYYVDEENRLFVHGGFNRHYFIDDDVHNGEETLLWDRDLFKIALSSEYDILPSKNKFKEIYIGHSPTLEWGVDKPIKACNIYNMDTGAAYTGRLSIFDITNNKLWQSDPLNLLYPNEKGRN